MANYQKYKIHKAGDTGLPTIKPVVECLETSADTPKEKQALNRTKIIAVLAIIVVIELALVICTGITHASLAQNRADTATLATSHQHDWQPDTVLVHHDAVTHPVEHEAVWQTVNVPHTVCNICGDVIDGKTDEHKAATGHESYTTGVPVPEQQLVSAAWTETVTDAEAYDELITQSYTCTTCGAQQYVPESEQKQQNA